MSTTHITAFKSCLQDPSFLCPWFHLL